MTNVKPNTNGYFDKESKKIKQTIEEFNKNERYKEYDRLVVLILVKKHTTGVILLGSGEILRICSNHSGHWDVRK